MAQSGSDLNAYVTNAFTFTGGALNNTANLGIVHLQGATGTINPGDGNTVTLGSSLLLEKNASNIGADITLGSGTVQGINVPDIIVGELCQIKRPPAELWVKLNLIGKVEMNGGEMSLHCVESDSYLLMNSGKVTIQAKNKGPVFNTDTVIFKGRIGAQGPSVKVTGGELVLEGGSTFKATSGIEVSGGLVTINPTAANLAGVANVVKIDGNMKVSGGEISFGAAGQGQLPNVLLSVEGTVTWTGGTYKPRIDSEDANFRSTLWKSSGKFTTGQGAKIDPVVLGNGQTFNNTWIVIESQDSIVGNADPAPIGNWTVTKEMNPVKRMGVKGK